jgi:dipeptidyl-peptidase-4
MNVNPDRSETMRRRRARAACAAASLFLSLVLFSLPAAAGGTKRLTYGQAYLDQEPRVLKPLTTADGWFDARSYLLRESDEKTKSDILYRVGAKDGARTIVLDYGRIAKNGPEGFPAAAPADTAADYSGLVYSYEADLYYYDVKANSLRRLTRDPEEEKNPTFSPDGRSVAYTRKNDLYAYDLAVNREVRLTTDGSDTVYNGRASWVYYEEILERASHYKAFWWSPDSRSLAYMRFDDEPVPVFPLFSSDGVHGRLELTRYPEAGDPNPKVRVGIVRAAGGPTVWADFDGKVDEYLAWPIWLPDSSRLTVQELNRDQNDLKIHSVDPRTGAKVEIYDEQQPTWVEFFESLTFLKDGSFLLLSDKSGWRQIYRYDRTGKLLGRITRGDWPVTGLALVDEKAQVVYFTAQKDPTTEVHLYRVRLDGTRLERLTRQPGRHEVDVAPGGAYFLDEYSNLEEPSRQDLCRGDGTLLRTIDRSRTPLLDEYALGRREIFSIATKDGWKLPAFWILPPDFDPAKKYPVVFTIYSGPGTTDVSNEFPDLRRFFLAQEGVIVFAVDHRGSSHFGKKGEALMYRNLGKWEVHDLSAAVRWLWTRPFVDPARIGITGGSYGGYMTCLALTAGADFFTHGFASSSVTDWRLYDSVYTERYMDKPSDNPEGYKAGSVQTYADRLKGALYMEHGDMDDNVHMQNSVQLIARLMDAGKDFEFMLYPDQRHGYRGKKKDFSNRAEYAFWMRSFFGRTVLPLSLESK